MSDFSDYPTQTIYFSLPPTPTPQIPLHYNPVSDLRGGNDKNKH